MKRPLNGKWTLQTEQRRKGTAHPKAGVKDRVWRTPNILNEQSAPGEQSQEIMLEI
jgi:hypothetical protein